MRRHIENLKQKPEHVRHRVALGVSAGFTGLVAVLWLTAHVATGTFVLSNPQAEPPAQVVDARGEFNSLVGAVGQALGTQPKDPELTVVKDGNTRTTIGSEPVNQNQTNQEVIPF